jgi:hypothetical protein
VSVDVGLAEFFAAMAPMLEGRASARHVEMALGPSASGTEALGFYAELVRRNLHKILSDVFPAVRAVARHLHGDDRAWAGLAAAYAAAHPGRGSDPNRFAEALPAWLRGRPEFIGPWSELAVELADYEWTRVLAYHAPDVEGDGLEQRLFVRQYTCDIPALAHAVQHGSFVPPTSRPRIVAIFRHARTLQLGVFHLGAAGLAALARRQGLATPPALAALPESAVRSGLAALEAAGVLPGGMPSPGMPFPGVPSCAHA